MDTLLQGMSPCSGREGIVTAIIDGRVETLAEVKNITASIELEKIEWNALGKRATMYKGANWKGTGSFTFHWMTKTFIEMAINTANTGKIIYFDLNVTNRDPQNVDEIGQQTIKLGQCSIDGAEIAKLDVGEGTMEGSVNFTFSEVEGLEYFKK